MAKIYRVLFDNEVIEFGQKDRSGVFECQDTPFVFFSFLIDRFPNLEMSDFADRFRGVVLSDEIGGGFISPKRLYDSLKATRQSFQNVRGQNETVDVMADKASAFVAAMKKKYGAEKNIPDTSPNVRTFNFEHGDTSPKPA